MNGTEEIAEPWVRAQSFFIRYGFLNGGMPVSGNADPARFGANITSEKSLVDFIWERDISEIFPLPERRLKELIGSDLSIESLFVDEAAEIRCSCIRDSGQVNCSGTHIKSTGALGPLRLKRKTQGRNKERIGIYLTAV